MDPETENGGIRPMTREDIPAGIRLREQAGWNQTEQDWRRFLNLAPDGCFVACEGGRVIGTVTTLAYERRFGWIGMLLVDQAHRGRGAGTRLLRRAMDSLVERGIETLKLDATPMGHPLYLQLGFKDEYVIERWEGIAGAAPRGVSSPMEEAEIAGVCEWDREIFGADRAALLTSLWQEGRRYCAVVQSASGISGYVLGRCGGRAHYIGPWLAIPGSGAAERLFQELLRRLDGERVFVDVCAGNPEATAIVKGASFRYQRSLTRMFLGPNRHPGRPPWVCGIAGPELG